MHHVAVGDDIFLAFEAQLAGIASAGFAVERDVIVIRDRLGADEALFEIGVDHPGRARRLGAAIDGPGARFLRTHREIGDEVEQLVTGADQAIEAGFRPCKRCRPLEAPTDDPGLERVRAICQYIEDRLDGELDGPPTLADIAERTPVTLAIKNGVAIDTTLGEEASA